MRASYSEAQQTARAGYKEGYKRINPQVMDSEIVIPLAECLLSPLSLQAGA